MRKQIAAANWKMNLTYQEAESLLDELLSASYNLPEHHEVILAVPAPYLQMALGKTSGQKNFYVAAQNVYSKKSGAFTGETSVVMLQSLGIKHAVIGHSERREYFTENNQLLADKVNVCLEHKVTPIFCCGESLDIREANRQNDFVSGQLNESLYHLSGDQIKEVVIAYEPIWAIGTGKTASSDQAQEMHAHIRSELAAKFGNDTAEQISVLYGGSVKGNNANDIFSKPDVDGGLVGGASLNAAEFAEIIKALK